MESNSDDEWDAGAPSPASNAPSPFLLAAQSEDAARLAHSMQVLAPIYREALVLRFQEDLSLQEISAIVGASGATRPLTLTFSVRDWNRTAVASLFRAA